MAGGTGRLCRHAAVLKMLSGKMTGIIYVETLSVWLHGMAGNAEFRLFRALHVRAHAADDAQSGQHAQADKGQLLPGRSTRERRAYQEKGRQHGAQDNLTNEDPNHAASVFGRSKRILE